MAPLQRDCASWPLWMAARGGNLGSAKGEIFHPLGWEARGPNVSIWQRTRARKRPARAHLGQQHALTSSPRRHLTPERALDARRPAAPCRPIDYDYYRTSLFLFARQRLPRARSRWAGRLEWRQRRPSGWLAGVFFLSARPTGAVGWPAGRNLGGTRVGRTQSVSAARAGRPRGRPEYKSLAHGARLKARSLASRSGRCPPE